jgi:putative endonuclease
MPEITAPLPTEAAAPLSCRKQLPRCHAGSRRLSGILQKALSLRLMERYWVYILASSKDGVLYTGVTSNLASRIAQHKAKSGDGFTSRYHATRLVYAHAHGSINDAIATEKRLKKWRRAWKVALIEQGKPDWRDLFDTLA